MLSKEERAAIGAGRLEEGKPFIPLRVAILTVSDRRTEAEDEAGDLLSARAAAAGHRIAARRLSRPDESAIRATVRDWAGQGMQVVLTSGGTGLGATDVTIEAVAPLFDKVIDGFAAVFHRISYDSIGLSTLQSRALAGLAGRTLVFCLPGSPGGCADGWDKVIRWQIDSRYRPCNLVGLTAPET